jgi:hypothetical protein
MKMHAENDLLMMEISKCSQDYIENRCYPSERVRALEDFCNEKELCINDFFEPLTYKTIILISLALIVMILFSECLVGRSRSNGIVRSKKEV